MDKLRSGEPVGGKPGETAKTQPSKEQSKQDQKTAHEKLKSTELVRRRPSDKNKHSTDKPKKRAVVYHDEGGSGYPDQGHHRHGTSSGSVDDYAKGSTSDEYRKRMHETRERFRDERVGTEDEADYYYRILAAALALVIVLSSSVLFYLEGQDIGVEEVSKKHTMNLEVLRYQFGVMSENMDCSIHMKRRAMQGDTAHNILRQGMMCLYALAPHTVHEESSLQMTILHKYSKQGYMEAMEIEGLNGLCMQKAMDPNCSLYKMPSYLNGIMHLKGALRESNLSNAWAEFGDLNQTYLEGVWSRSYWENRTINGHKMTVQPRKFRVPHLLVNLTKTTRHIEKRMKSWLKRFPNIAIKHISVRDIVTITPDEAQRAASAFASSTVEPKAQRDQLTHYQLTYNRITHIGTEIIFPRKTAGKQSTLSFISAFIVKVVYEAFQKAKPKEKSYSIQMMSISAQMLAMQFLKKTREWTGNPKDPSLLNMWDKAVHRLLKKPINQEGVKVFRNSTDRVTAVMLWDNTKLHEWFTMMELALPQPFDPNDNQGRRVKFAPFVDINGEKSAVEYCSAAGIALFESSPESKTPLMAAAAMGTERTVEGVANAILKVLLLKEQAGWAVKPAGSYLNPADGKIYCDIRDYRAFYNRFGVKCDVVGAHEPNRMVMIAEKYHYKPSITMAITQSFGEYIYGSGF